MSEKNRDNKNRWRNVTIAFRMSPEENKELRFKSKDLWIPDETRIYH